MLQPGQHLVLGERGESEAGASRLEGGDDFREVVADEAEASVLRIFLDNPPEGVLSVGCHSVSLVEDHQLEAWVGGWKGGGGGEEEMRKSR